MPAPLIFRVTHHEGAWSVEHEGRFADRSSDKAVAVASATKLARAAALQGGRQVQVRVDGSPSTFRPALAWTPPGPSSCATNLLNRLLGS